MPKLRTESPVNPNSPNQSKRKKPRVIIYKNDDGSYDTSSLSDEEKERLFGGATGAPPPSETTAPPPPIEPIDPAVMGIALNLLVSIEAAFVGQRFGIDHGAAFSALSPKPPMGEILNNLACKVANKYGASLGPWADEIALGAMLVTWQVSAFTEIRRIIADQRSGAESSAPPPPPPPPTPPPPPEPRKEPIPIDVLLGAHTQQMGGEC